MIDLVGRVLDGRYRVERPLGQGGMGVVYAGVQIDLARPVAIKTLIDVDDPKDLERLRVEALAAASLAHPHIVQVSDFVEAREGAPAFLVMELLRGRPLSRLLAQRGSLPPKVAVRVALQVLDALAAAHRAGIIHRDVKPANVIVLDGDDEAPFVKLVDFGIAKLLTADGRRTTTGAWVGTPAYMAPEQLLGLEATPASDAHAVGVCLFEMLTGRRPFAGQGGEAIAQVLSEARPDRSAYASLPRPLGDVVARAIARSPSERFATAEALAQALREATAEPSPDGATRPAAELPPAPGRPLPEPAPSRWPVFALALVATLALGLGIALVAALRRPPAAGGTTAAAPPPSPGLERHDDGGEDASTDATEGPAVDAALALSDAAHDGAAPVRAAKRAVRCYCYDGGHFALCPELVFECECSGDRGAMFDGAEASSRRMVQRLSSTALDGAPCAGYIHVAESYERTTGAWRCHPLCDSAERKKGIRLAVPGTPCVGYELGERRHGRWVPYD